MAILLENASVVTLNNSKPLLEGQHRSQHELGDWDRRRAPCARDGAAVEELVGEAVDAGASEVHPVDPLREVERVRPPAAEQHIGS